MRTGRALIIVDVQNDFCEGGSLAVVGGAGVAASIRDHVAAHRDDYDLIVCTRDWHQDPGPHFSEDPDFVDSWPPHCVADTTGAQLRAEVAGLASEVFDKGEHAAAYSGFEGRTRQGLGLEEALRKAGVERADVVGLATDHCVRATALDARRIGLAVRVPLDLCAAVSPATAEAAVQSMRAAGCTVR